MDNMTMFIINHVIRLLRHKTEKVNMAEYNLSVHAILNIFLERAFYLSFFFWYKVPFAHQLKLLKKY